MERTWTVGTTLESRWDIHKVLPGSAGVVYIVHDRTLNEVLAAKTFADVPQPRFLGEAAAWIRLNAHPHIVQARFAQEIEGTPVLFLEYAAGGGLCEWIGTPRLLGNLPAVLRLAVELCDGMIHARANGMAAHGDIRPRNCLLTAAGALKLTGFGFATPADAGRASHMAPELFADAASAAAPADIYAFGVLLFQMLTGRLPFAGRDWREFAAMHSHQPAALEALPAAMQPLVARCLAKMAEYRWRDFVEVRHQLSLIHQTLFGQPAPAPALAEPAESHLLNEGAALAAAGLHGQAIAHYDQALALQPGNAYAWAFRGNAFLETGDLREATACYTRAVAADPNLDEVWCNQAVIFHRIELHAESLRCLDRALELNPASARAWAIRGRVLNAAGHAGEAAESFAAINPNQPEAPPALAPQPEPELSASQWHTKGAELAQQDQFAEALTCFENAVEKDPSAALSWVHRGLMLRKLGRKEDALVSCDRALEVNPELALAWFTKGMLLGFELQRYAAALPCLEKAAALGQNAQAAIDTCRARLTESEPAPTAISLRQQGRQLLNEGKPAEALACFEKALQMGLAVEDLCGRSLALTALARHQEALRAYEEAIKLAPDFAPGYYRDEARQLGAATTSQAPAAVRQLATLPPPLEPDADAAGWHKRGHALMESGGDPEDALRYFERALALDPAHAGSWSGKAVCLNTLGRVEESIAAWQETIRLRPDAPGPLMSLASILYNASRFEEALAYFETARKLGDTEAWQGAYRCRQAMAPSQRTPPAL